MDSHHDMKLVLSTPLLGARQVALEFNKFVQHYARTFSVRTAPYSHGVRFLLAHEKSNLSCLKDGEGANIAVTVAFEADPSPAFLGRNAAFLGGFALRVKEEVPGAEICAEVSTLPDFATLEAWGRWAVGEVNKRFPMS